MIFNYKNTRFFVFSDTHRFHKCIDIPQDIDVVICLGDAVEDNLNPQDYARFLDWYATQLDHPRDVSECQEQRLGVERTARHLILHFLACGYHHLGSGNPGADAVDKDFSHAKVE